MSRQFFLEVLNQEVARIDKALVSKRRERVIESFTKESNTKAIIDGKKYTIFNSNDYLGLRHHPQLMDAEHLASLKYGVGPGAVRFISGSLKIYTDLEKALAEFHKREAAMVFSSAFATNLAVLFSLIKGQSKDSLIGGDTLVISDELNHRSIIEGVRVAGLDGNQKVIFPHLRPESTKQILKDNIGRFKRVIIVTDGVFSMLGEFQDLKMLREFADIFDESYEEGVWLIVDDAHGIAASGATGRGTEEVAGVKADILIGTLGKGFGVDGGYVVGNQQVIDYLREAAATYIYSNSISPGTAGAALASVNLVNSIEGQSLLAKLNNNINVFKEGVMKTSLTMAADSHHPIQPLLIGDPEKSQILTRQLFEAGFMVTSINYPVVPKGRDEIRIQIAATHSKEDIQNLLKTIKKSF